MTAHVRKATIAEVPILDFAPLNSGGDIGAVAAEMRRACETIGFFYVANHGVPKEIFDGMFDVTRKYFNVPAAQRAAHPIDRRIGRGFMPQGINQQTGYAADIKECFDVGVDLGPDDPSVKAGVPLHGANVWPSDVPWLRPPVEAYFNEVGEFGKRVTRVLAASLGMPPDFFVQFLKKPMVKMRMVHYPPQVADDNAFGIAPHTDYGFLTLLSQDPIGGLELEKRDGEYIAAPFVDNTFIVNIGDLLQRWTNDVYMSNQHRVINRTGKERYSIPTFFNLDFDAMVECLPSCCGPDNPAKYAPITSGEYLLGRYKDVQKLKDNA